MKSWLIAHFNVQQGMYFDRLYSEEGMIYFGSDHIQDSAWNYGVIDRFSVENILKFEVFCKNIKKMPYLYLSKEEASNYNKILADIGFFAPMDDGKLVTETWMEFTQKKYHIEKSFDIQMVSTDKQRSDFVEVFLSAYGGEKTPEKPYGDLPVEYKQCVEKAFDNPKFYNFICYCDKTPVSVATLCMFGEYGGLYNIGTKPQYERRGFGLAVTDACINMWETLSGKSLFLQTETGTGIDSWYERVGFRRVFEGVVYEKE